MTELIAFVLAMNVFLTNQDTAKVIEVYKREVKVGVIFKKRAYSETLELKSDSTFIYTTWGKECNLMDSEERGTWKREANKLRLEPINIGSIPSDLYLVDNKGLTMPNDLEGVLRLNKVK